MILMKKIALTATLALVLTACSPASDDSDHVSVMSSIYPAQFLAESIGGDLVEVTPITAPGADPHETELTPRRTAELLESDVVLWFSGIQPALDSTLAESKRDEAVTIDLASPSNEDETDHDHDDDDHDHDHDEVDHDDHGHSHDGTDPHSWLNPGTMEDNVAHVRDALIAAAPEHKAAFTENAEKLHAELAQLHEDFEAGLSNCKQRTFVTGHAAFGHLAEEFDLEQVAALSGDSHDEPSAAELARIATLMKNNNITTVFSQSTEADATAKTLARETGATIAVLNPLEFAPTAPADYVSVMRHNLAALTTAMACQ